jgi:hypothetical protein
MFPIATNLLRAHREALQQARYRLLFVMRQHDNKLFASIPTVPFKLEKIESRGLTYLKFRQTVSREISDDLPIVRTRSELKPARFLFCNDNDTTLGQQDRRSWRQLPVKKAACFCLRS